ncbi:ATP-binding protein [Aliiglaciecola sp.]|nr:ATP-binding protein [Aliiglaciecola sp.]
MNSVGRQIETALLDEQLNRIVSAFIIIYGRRRVGKTYFVRDYCEKNNIELLEFTGLFNESTKKQLEHFVERLNERELQEELPTPTSWTKAFGILNKFIERHFPNQKVIIFLDEAPWMDSGRSDFIAAVGDLWDNRIRNNPNKQLILCGSAASYMLKKIIANKGPLHQRPTKVIEMKPFNLNLTKKLIEFHGWHIQERSICETYIAVGGVAKYLSDLNKAVPPEQSIHQACFERNGIIHNEYKELFNSLFKQASAHYVIMDALSQQWCGMTNSELTDKLGIHKSIISKAIKELVSSGFIETRPLFPNEKKGERLIASDMFCFFHHKWIKKNTVKDWTETTRKQSYRSWAGFAFERICQLHTYQIKKKLGISGVSTQTHYWEYKGDENSKGAQIDTLLEHTNGSKNIDLIECKYYDGEFTISKEYHDKLIQKRRIFDEKTGHKYNIRLVMVTTNGVTKNQYFNGLNIAVVTLSDLFSSEP